MASHHLYIGYEIIFKCLVGIAAIAGINLPAQTYQSSFSPVKYDKSKSINFSSDIINVDIATGAVNINLPLGPGIGARGAFFQPKIAGRHSGVRTVIGNSGGSLGSDPGDRSHGNFGISPGTLKFQGAYLLGRLDGPNGESETFGRSNFRITDSNIPTKLLSTFGFDGNLSCFGPRLIKTINSETNQTIIAKQPEPGLVLTSGGAIVIPFNGPSNLLKTVSTPEGANVTYKKFYEIPERILVVKGDIAYEFIYINHTWSLGGGASGGSGATMAMSESMYNWYNPSQYWEKQPPIAENIGPAFSEYNNPGDVNPGPSNAGTNHVVLKSIDYVIKSIRNKFGESIEFDYAEYSNGLEYTAEWYRNNSSTGVRIEQKYINSSQGPQSTQYNIKISYHGINHNAYLIGEEITGIVPLKTAEWWNSRGKNIMGMEGHPIEGFGGLLDAMEAGRIVHLTPESSPGEKIAFNWVQMGEVSHLYLLQGVSTSSRKESIKWTTYEYRENHGVNHNVGFYSIEDPGGRCPRTYSFGVNELEISDIATGSSRKTTFNRVVPKPDWNLRNAWSTKDFYTVVNHPDGSNSLYRFMPPPNSSANNTLGGPHAPKSEQVQTLAFLKNALIEERHYPKNVMIDITSNPDQCKADKVIIYDRFTFLSSLNSTGEFGISDSPNHTRTRSLDLINKTMLSKENIDWVASERGWSKIYESIFGSIPSISIPGTSQILSLHDLGSQPDNESPVIKKLTTCRHRSNLETWTLGQKVEESISTIFDNSPNYIGHSGAPFKSETYKYDDLNRIEEVNAGTSNKITIWYSYLASTGKDAPLAKSAKLQGPFPGGGTIGSVYSYDEFGFMNGIQPSLSSPSMVARQTNDAANRPTAQTGVDGLSTGVTWDPLGRLSRVTPPGGDHSTAYVADPDGLGLTITRGNERTQIRYNAFGELVLERRFNDYGAPSHRMYGYDKGGRKIWETTWRPGPGSDTAWHLPNAPEDQVREPWTEVTDECASWTTGYVNGVPTLVCESYLTIEHPATIVNVNSTHYKYDNHGRLVLVVDPNGDVVATEYYTKHKKQIAGSRYDGSRLYPTTSTAQTYFVYDDAGRLSKIVDAEKRVTDYFYDEASRVVRSKQYASQSLAYPWNGTGTAQVRSWVYNSHGWLVALDQPESGVTYYTSFTIQGKPQETIYGLPGGWRPAGVNTRDSSAFSVTGIKIVNSTYDDLGRLIRVWSSDGSIDHEMIYGTAGSSPQQSVGKLVRAQTSKGVSRELEYAPNTGRLSKLTRLIDGHSFIQGFDYDAYGHNTYRSYPGGSRSQSISYQNATGLPYSTSYNQTKKADLFYDDLWLLNSITFGTPFCGTSYTYAPDQQRLVKMIHKAPGISDKTFNYDYTPSGLLNSDGESWYTYDLLGRLTLAFTRDLSGIAKQGVRQKFGYDAFGNRILSEVKTVTNWDVGKAPPSTPTLVNPPATFAALNLSLNAAVTATKNQLPPTTTQGYATGAAYDPQGNLVQVFPRVGASGEAISMSYDALGRVSSMAYGPSATRKAEQYLYDDEGLRIRVWDGSKYRYNIYNEARQLIAQYEKTPTGPLTWKKDILYVGTKEIAEVSSDGKTRVTLCDHLGSPRFIWDGATTPVQQKFLPFGEALHDPTTAGKFAKGFTNHEQTDATGLIYMQARFYLPMYGRFASPDPARDQHFEETQSWNIYSYVQNNPVVNIDPTGETLICATVDQNNLTKYNNAIKYLMKNAKMREIITKLQKSENIYAVHIIENGGDKYSMSEKNIYWDPNSALALVDNAGNLTGGTHTPALGLGHELDHAAADDAGKIEAGSEPNYGKNGKEEKRVIEGSETSAAKTLKEGVRKNHYGVPYESTGPTSSKPTAKGKEKIKNQFKKINQKPIKLKTKETP